MLSFSLRSPLTEPPSVIEVAYWHHKRTRDHKMASDQPDAALFSRPYAFRKASRSALIVSACVVGMPCGKPL